MPPSERPSSTFIAGVAAVAAVAAVLAVFVQVRRADQAAAEVARTAPVRPPSVTETIAATAPVTRGTRLDVFTAVKVGTPVGPDDRPMIANVAAVDLDNDGRLDVVAADAAANRIVWLRQSAPGAFTESTLADVPGPAHVHACLRALALLP